MHTIALSGDEETQVTVAQVEKDVDFDFLPLYEIFGVTKYYRVGEYQRGFSWGIEQFDQLFKDFTESFVESPEATYLLGQIIVCPTRQKNTRIKNFISQLDLIDGQQRCTSLLMLFLSIHSTLEKYADELGTLDISDTLKELKTIVQLKDQNQEDIPRVKAAFDGGEFIRSILTSQITVNAESQTQKNMEAAWDYFGEQIKANFPVGNVEGLVQFAEYLMHRVFLVSVTVPTAARAVSIFQKVNNRGLALDESDLIKSFLFLKANPEEYNSYSESWDKASQNVFGSRLKRTQSMEFLLKLMIGMRKGSSISISRLYEEWQKILKLGQEELGYYPVGRFAKDLEEKSKYLQNITLGKLPGGQLTHPSTGKGIFELKAVQQYEVQLAGAHLVPESYNTLLAIIEDRTLLSLWSGELSQEFERIIHPWAKKVSETDAAAGKDELREASESAFSVNSFADLFDRAQNQIARWDYNTRSNVLKIRYLLARIYSAAEETVGQTMSISELMKTSKVRNGERVETGFDIDHVLPKTQETHWRQNTRLNLQKGDESRFLQKVHSIGNLILLHSSDNRSQGDDLPWSENKKENLGQSHFILNKLLVDEHYYGQLNTRLKSQVDIWQSRYRNSAQQWDEENIDERLGLYLSILKQGMTSTLLF